MEFGRQRLNEPFMNFLGGLGFKNPVKYQSTEPQKLMPREFGG
jgi:hypothetical protein